ncbi:ABC transporter ATP-binding protein [Paenibacillus sp. GCM10027627]|uniref:ABC transporter ATP-binding protein n=1 Tax=unclassified Paenibacillus TaxID=185978 RepID=UPI00364243FF
MKPLLEIKDLHVGVKSSRGPLPVLEAVSLSVYPGDVLGIVGESGCGKSVLSLAIAGLLPPALRIREGEIVYREKALGQASGEELRRLRGKELAMVFQDPMTSLNPSLTIGRQLVEMLRLHMPLSRKEATERAAGLLEKVGLPDPAACLKAYPHQLSGGMRQRVMIAMAVSCSPGLLIADEATTALDATIQLQILDLLQQIQKETGMTIILISHDLGVVSEVCNRVAVMYAGRVVEEGPAASIFRHPRHPYTIALLESIPTPAKKNKRLFSIPGTVPALDERGSGCSYSSRCAHAVERCFAEIPLQVKVSSNHTASCLAVAEEGAIAHVSR